ncbi:MAG: hypothetical protein KJ666_00005, partial [Bacteroidetes bacterium]|nr:hypothetical protein [Bacteroidota bacterium]
KNIELILFFVRYPDRVFTKTFSKDEINEAGKKFSRFIDQITDNNFQKNLAHCSICEYYTSGSCLI